MLVRPKKRRETVSLLMKLMPSWKCQAVNGALENASQSLEDEDKRSISVKDVTTLRDALITSLAIRSLRRALEFIEFTLR